MNEADVTKKRLAIEKADLEKQLNDGENALRNLSKLRTSLSTQVRGFAQSSAFPHFASSAMYNSPA